MLLMYQKQKVIENDMSFIKIHRCRLYYYTNTKMDLMLKEISVISGAIHILMHKIC